MAETKEKIVIGDDGFATYERRVVLPVKDGRPYIDRVVRVYPDGREEKIRDLEPERVMDTKKVDIGTLIPSRGQPYLLPEFCRFVLEEEGKTVFVLQEPPMLRTIRWFTSGADSRHGNPYQPMKNRLLKGGAHHLWGETVEQFEVRLQTQTEFRLAFPYLIKCYCFVGDAFSYVTLWFRSRPLKSERDGLLIPNLPNRDDGFHYKKGALCLTETARHQQGKSFAEMIRIIEGEFWGAAWNDHWMQEFLNDAVRLPEVASPWEWERMSAADPLFITRLKWREAEFSVAEEMRRLLGREEERQPSFQWFLDRVRQADPWNVTPPVSEKGIRVSPSETITLEKDSISIGDKIVFKSTLFMSIQAGTQYAVEWFSRMDGANGRLVKLAGINEPLPIIVRGKLVDGCSVVVNEVVAPPVMVNGLELVPQMFLRITDANFWPGRRTSQYLQFTKAEHGSRASILVQISGEEFQTAIGEGGKLFPGLEIIPEEELDWTGYLKTQEMKLADGTVVRVGERYYYEHDNELHYYRVAAFASLQHGDLVRYFLNSPTPDRIALEEKTGGASRLIAMPAGEGPRFVKVSNQMIRVGDTVRWNGRLRKIEAFTPVLSNRRQYAKLGDHWLLFLVDGKPCKYLQLLPRLVICDGVLQFGEQFFEPGSLVFDQDAKKVRQIAKFEKPESSRVMATFADGESISFINDWKLNERLTPVLRRFRWQRDITLARGNRLRLREEVPGVPAGKRFVVSHLQPSQNGHQVIVVLSNGLSFDLVSQNAQLFETRRHNQWIPLIKDGGPAKEVLGRPGEGLRIGAKVSYLGGDPGTEFGRNNSEDLAKNTRAIIERADRSYWFCKFDREIPGATRLNYNELSVCQWIRDQYLASWNVEGIKNFGFSVAFYTRRGSDKKLVNPGEVVGTDATGKILKIGDRVRVSRLAGDISTRRAEELVLKEHIFTIVHNTHYEGWLYLDAGEDVGYSPSYDLVGRERLPQELNENKKWWSFICLARYLWCTLVA